jgi:diguanylate cyclase (GGDEF)-like protein
VIEKQLTAPDLSESWVEISTYPIFGSEGDVTYVLEHIRDITERKRAEQEKKELIDKLAFLSITDSLTGLLNKKALIERFASELTRVKRYRSEMSLILCDIDSFKEINDTHGHTCGDEVLKKVSKILKNSVRTNDIVGRYGGDEFLLVLPETSRGGAEELAERIRDTVQKEEIAVAGGKPITTTLSLGIAHFSDGGEAYVQELIDRADKALYTSKRTGKNRTSLSD